MSKLECKVVSLTGDHHRISLTPTQLVPFSLGLDEIEHRIVQAYMGLVFPADDASGSRTVSVIQSGLLGVQMTEMPLEVLVPGMPLFMLEVFLLPSHATVDGYGFFDLDDTELAAAAEFVLEAARQAETMMASTLH
jgi:hypothetical protein